MYSVNETDLTMSKKKFSLKFMLLKMMKTQNM